MTAWIARRRPTRSVPGGRPTCSRQQVDSRICSLVWGFASADDRNRLEAFLRNCTKTGLPGKAFDNFRLYLWWCRLQTLHSHYQQHSTPAVSILPLNASITTLSLFINAVTTFNFLIAHPFSDKNFSMRMLYCDAFYWQFYIFSSYSLCNSVLSVILLKLKWNEMTWEWQKGYVCLLCRNFSIPWVHIALGLVLGN